MHLKFWETKVKKFRVKSFTQLKSSFHTSYEFQIMSINLRIIMEILKVELLLYRMDVFKNIIKKLLNRKADELIFKKYNLWLWEHVPMSTNSKVVLHRLRLMKTHFLFFLNFVSMSAFIIFHKKAKGNWYPQCRSSLSPPKESSF